MRVENFRGHRQLAIFSSCVYGTGVPKAARGRWWCLGRDMMKMEPTLFPGCRISMLCLLLCICQEHASHLHLYEIHWDLNYLLQYETLRESASAILVVLTKVGHGGHISEKAVCLDLFYFILSS